MSDLLEAARWLVRMGYPFDFSFKDAPPEPFRQAIIDAVYEDPDGDLGVLELDADEVATWVAEEAGWHARDSD